MDGILGCPSVDEKEYGVLPAAIDILISRFSNEEVRLDVGKPSFVCRLRHTR